MSVVPERSLQSSPIPITRPVIDSSELEAIRQPLESGWLVQGPITAEFEQRVAQASGVRHGIATTSCTTALHLSLVAAGIGNGHEVVVPAFTWIATANVVEHTGARPIFCDIDPYTFNIDPECAERAITSRTRAIIPVHLFGLCADMDPLTDLARRKSITLIEDAACALGSSMNGVHAGGFGAAGCLSFHPRKVITTGEGGMVLTNSDDFANRCRILRDHGAETTDFTRHSSKRGYLLTEFNLLGFNYRMTDLQAALGVSQMSKLDSILAGRRRLALRYDEELKELPWLETPAVPPGHTHAYQSYVCRFLPGIDSIPERNTLRNDLMESLESDGIATRQGTHAVHALGYYSQKYDLAPSDYPGAWEADQTSLALPLYPQMSEAEQDRVIEALRAGYTT